MKVPTVWDYLPNWKEAKPILQSMFQDLKYLFFRPKPMQLELSSRALNLLSFTLSFDGKSELDKDGNDVPVTRRLNGEESSQRRFFLKEAREKVKDIQDQINELLRERDEFIKPYNALVTEKRELAKATNQKEEGEKSSAYEGRINAIVLADAERLQLASELDPKLVDINAKTDELQSTKVTLDLTDKTVDVCKKYFQQFGDEAGFPSGDDIAVEELTKVLGL